MELSDATRLVARWRSGAVATEVANLAGGVSASTDVITWADGDGASGRVVARRAGLGDVGDIATAFKAQAAVSVWARAQGVPTPELYINDFNGEALGEPCLVFAHIEGRPNVGPIGLSDFTGQVAAALHALHAHALDDATVGIVAPAADPRTQYAGVAGTNALTQKAAAVLAGWDAWDAGPTRLLHGDFWPGNLLWVAGKLAAVIDWEDAAIGDPQRDLAITCLDLRWLFGSAAPDAFIRAYESHAGAVDRRQLAHWQLWAGLRPLGKLDRWATAYPPLGRPDVTPRAMQAAIEASLAEALRILGA